MAEDADFIEAIEASPSVRFIGPSAAVIRRAGAKDEAKKLARALGNAVIPGIDNVSALALLDQAGDRAGPREARQASTALRFDVGRAPELDENAEPCSRPATRSRSSS